MAHSPLAGPLRCCRISSALLRTTHYCSSPVDRFSVRLVNGDGLAAVRSVRALCCPSRELLLPPGERCAKPPTTEEEPSSSSSHVTGWRIAQSGGDGRRASHPLTSPHQPFTDDAMLDLHSSPAATDMPAGGENVPEQDTGAPSSKAGELDGVLDEPPAIKSRGVALPLHRARAQGSLSESAHRGVCNGAVIASLAFLGRASQQSSAVGRQHREALLKASRSASLTLDAEKAVELVAAAVGRGSNCRRADAAAGACAAPSDAAAAAAAEMRLPLRRLPQQQLRRARMLPPLLLTRGRSSHAAAIRSQGDHQRG